MIVMYRRLNKQRSIFTSSQALMKAIYLDYKKFEIGGAKSVQKKKSDPYVNAPCLRKNGNGQAPSLGVYLKTRRLHY